MDINGKVVSYADDTVLIFNGTTWDEVKEKAKLGLHKVKSWLDTYKLSLNSKKNELHCILADFCKPTRL